VGYESVGMGAHDLAGAAVTVDQFRRGAVHVPPSLAMPHTKLPPFELVRDTREQSEPPWPTHTGSGPRRRDVVLLPHETVGEGDYSSSVLRGVAVVERKSAQDYAQTITWDRERWEREIARLTSYDHRVVIVEASFDDVCAVSGATPTSLEGSTDSFFSRDIPVYFTTGRAHTGRSIVGILSRWERRYMAKTGRLAMLAERDMGGRGMQPRRRRRTHQLLSWEAAACREAGIE
jgi:hypothetical protein